MIQQDRERILQKMKRYLTTYFWYPYRHLADLPCEILQDGKERFAPPSPDENWQSIADGGLWGGEHGYAWFRTRYTVPAEYAGKTLYLKSELGEAEGLLFLNGRPCGMFDYNAEVSLPETRLHIVQLLADRAEAGTVYEIAVEAYAGHKLYGCAPFEQPEDCGDNPYPRVFDRVCRGLAVYEIDPAARKFRLRLRLMLQLYEGLPDSDDAKWRIFDALLKIYEILPQMPQEYDAEECAAAVAQALDVTEPFFREGADSSDFTPTARFGLIGHSHLDTAWRWPVSETVHKAARTFANALSMMERYPDYTFVQSSVLYLSWMKDYYPDLFEGIRRRVAEGRWEPNGGSWVESDANMTGGEYLIRQFLRGQRFLKENFGYHADCYWLPDTFGYSSAIPQIMRGFGMKYFLTTKLSWNESNAFPYDTFIWRGIDGSEVFSHFNLTHCWPDAETLLNNRIRSADVSCKKLLAYGFGDGGGGPSGEMIETAEMLPKLPGLPRTEHTTVSAFMQDLERTARTVPVYDGELYLELHRGTLTQIHEIKRSNRKAELAIRDLEIIGSHRLMNGGDYPARAAQYLDTLMTNQFHDILPGSSIAEVHDLAVRENYGAAAGASHDAADCLRDAADASQIAVYNTLSWDRVTSFSVADHGAVPEGGVWQRYTAPDGEKRIAVSGVKIPAMAAVNLKMSADSAQTVDSPFVFSGRTVETPFARIELAENGGFASFYDKRCDREAANTADIPLNTFLFGEDIPLEWDNWDINYDQRLKMKPITAPCALEQVSNGPLQLRLRRRCSLGRGTALVQDIVFYSDTPRIDFETVVDWNSPHMLLKAAFPTNIRAPFARFETQFGFVTRATHANNSIDAAKFEVCNHKWTDLSENRYGAAVLNDCKYGVSVEDGTIALTLHKGGCRPDPRGDVGRHCLTYSFLPHTGGFTAETVVRGAYELNIPPVCTNGISRLTAPMLRAQPENIIAEAIKRAEDGEDLIVRLYECEGTRTNARISLPAAGKRVYETDMAEESPRELCTENGGVSLEFGPFEIKTLRIAVK